MRSRNLAYGLLISLFAFGAEINRDIGQSRKLAFMRQIPWHYPTTAQLGWTCWSAVLELALRRMIATALGRDPLKDCWLVRGGAGHQPTVLFSSNVNHAFQGLSIRVEGTERFGPAHARFRSIHQVAWDLPRGGTFWPLASRPKAPGTDPNEPLDVGWSLTGRLSMRAPDAGVIWRWASDTATAEDIAMIPTLLALPRESETKQAQATAQ